QTRSSRNPPASITPHPSPLTGPQSLSRVFLFRNIRPPRAMGEIPIDGLGDAGGKVLAGDPAQLTLELGAIDGVAAVMAGPVGDVGDLRRVGLAVGPRRLAVEQ